MILHDLHIHTTYCDGKNTAEEMVLAAIQKSMKCIGFSSHSYTPFDKSYCMQKEQIQNYKDEITGLKQKYKDKIQVLLGIEQDFYSTEPTHDYDYVIGSVHYIKNKNGYFPVDEDKETFFYIAQQFYGGDFIAFAEEYYHTVAQIKNADIIGHFDLITKFNEGFCLFDETDPRYVAAYRKAADELLKQDVFFEINTGAISRGYRTTPYPSLDIRNYIADRGGKFIWSSDSHCKDTLLFGFAEK